MSTSNGTSKGTGKELSDTEITSRLKALASSQVGDVQDRFGIIDGAISALDPSKRFVGRARTVLTAGGDNKIIHEIIPTLRPGDVLFVNGQGVTHRALMGELMSERCQNRGAAAIVIDGAIRDSQEIISLGVPMYARAVTPAGPYRNGPGRIDVPVAIGGVVVAPNDWVIGDGDGIAVIEASSIQVVLEKGEAKLKAEQDQMAGIRAGTVI
ncbi:MAG: RraA family protein [Ancrocorticia sp.]|uniref:RraA family protein n=1 Tax=Ancrocorticia sp. TaxID=2593684 RepID=UPI003F933403